MLVPWSTNEVQLSGKIDLCSKYMAGGLFDGLCVASAVRIEMGNNLRWLNIPFSALVILHSTIPLVVTSASAVISCLVD